MTTTKPHTLTQPPARPALRPRELLDAQRDLCRWWQGDDGLFVADSYVNLRDGVASRPRLADGIEGTDITATEAYGLARSTPFWVSADMTELTAHAAKTWDPPPLHPDVLPAREGFAYFERPLYPFWFSSNAASIRAVRWIVSEERRSSVHRSEPGVLTTWYSHLDDGGDTLLSRELLAGKTNDRLRNVYGAGFVLLSYSFWPWGSVPRPGVYLDRPAASMGIDDPDHSGFSSVTGLANTDPSDSHAWNHERFIECLWTMMGQTIAKTARVVERHAAKRARRAGMTAPAEAGVRVVTLRREALPAEAGERTVEHRQVDWSCRWLVGSADGGHWHKYRTRNGIERRWVGVYEKGPPDKPLRFSKPVYKLTR